MRWIFTSIHRPCMSAMRSLAPDPAKVEVRRIRYVCLNCGLVYGHRFPCAAALKRKEPTGTTEIPAVLLLFKVLLLH